MSGLQRNLSRPAKFNSKARESGNADAPRRGAARPRTSGANVPRTIEEPDEEDGRGKKRRIVQKQRGVGQKNYDDDEEDLATSLLSDELRDALASNSGYGTEDVITQGSKKRTAKAQPAQTGKRLSAKQAKRLRRVLEQKEKKKKRKELLAGLGTMQMTKEQAALLSRTSSISSKMTTKERLRQQLREQRAGIQITSAIDDRGKERSVLVPRTAPAAAQAAPDSETDYSSTDEEDNANADDVAKAAAAADLAAAAAAMAKEVRATHLSGVAAAKRTRPTTLELMRRPRAAPGPAAVFVNVNRTMEIQTARLNLPILQEEHAIIEAIKQHPVTIICGETGSGKTTQVPQFLYEAGFTGAATTTAAGAAAGAGAEDGKKKAKQPLMMVGVTEPRRIAAVSVSKRVKEELALTSKEVSYQIRFEGTTTDSTAIKFMTDGVLAREIEADFALRKYSAIVVDEAHERSMHTDIILGLLSRIVPLRAQLAKQKRAEGEAIITPLKLIIMSATLRVEEFTKNARLFPSLGPIPVLSVDGRQFPVTTHFTKRTKVDEDNVAEAFRKVCQIHQRLPAGGILVFLTGKTDINDLCTRLAEKYGHEKVLAEQKTQTAEELAEAAAADAAMYAKRMAHAARQSKAFTAATKAAKAALASDDEEEEQEGGKDTKKGAEEEEIDGILSDSEDEGDADADAKAAAEMAEFAGDGDTEVARFGPLHVLPLYSNLSSEQQARVFDAVPAGHRLCVVATNVAETSLTIPGVKYVVDTGQVKSRHYDKVTGVSSFEVEWVSKASANQRAGRAGRTGPGHCYRLYSSAVFENEFDDFTEPEILRLPADGLVLQMKAMNIDKVTNFPFPTPPERPALYAAEKLLKLLGALDTGTGRITTLGQAMVKYPVAPRYAKMLCLARHYDCMPYVIAIVAALTVKELFVTDAAAELQRFETSVERGTDAAVDVGLKAKAKAAMHQWRLMGISGGGDLAAMLYAVGASDHVLAENGTDLDEFCLARSLRVKAIREIIKLRKQLSKIGNVFGLQAEEAPEVGGEDSSRSSSSSRGGGGGGGGGGGAKHEVLAPPSEKQLDATRQIVLAGFGDNVARISPIVTPEMAKYGIHSYNCSATEEPIFIHPASVLAKQKPDLVVFHELVQGKTKLYMKGVTVVHFDWLPRLVPSLCTFSKPLELPAPRYDPTLDDIRCHMSGVFGDLRWPLNPVDLPYPENADRYRYFARFLLEGGIFPALAKYTAQLKNKPTILNKPWSKARVVALLQPLIDNKIDSKAKLEAKWTEDKRFLLDAYALWLDADLHQELVSSWPPVADPAAAAVVEGAAVASTASSKGGRKNSKK